MRLILVLFSFLIISCASGPQKMWHFPAGKTQADFYNDLNECTAVGKQIAGPAGVGSPWEAPTYTDNCLKGKGYLLY